MQNSKVIITDEQYREFFKIRETDSVRYVDSVTFEEENGPKGNEIN